MPFALLGGFDIIRHGPRRERPGSLRINRGVHFVEPYAAQDIHRLQELSFGFAWEPNDDIGRYSDATAECLAYLFHLLKVLSARVPATHVGEHGIVTGLKWQVNHFADLR